MVREGKVSVLNKVAKQGITERRTFEQRCGGEGIDHMRICGRAIQGEIARQRPRGENTTGRFRHPKEAK